ncbi:MAG: type I phosphomannose isomerase catalytic subunit [Phycisphaerales bacterium]
MNPYPLKFKPIYKELIWGGHKLANILNKDFPKEAKIGESWELVDLPNDKNQIINGEFAGKTISDVLSQYSQQIMGKKYSPPFGLLIKFIDAADVLSVQVHPDTETVKKLKSGSLKTECWYIIDAEKGACIYKGLKKGTTREQFEKSILDGTCANLLNKIPVKPGECHFLPAGTVHAIGAGLLIAEIQTPSDTTYRVFDWNRLQNGKPRQLHIEQALESIHFGQNPDELTVETKGRLVDCEYFKVDKITSSANKSIEIASGVMKVLVIIKGKGQIISSKTQAVDFAKGETILLPADFEGKINFDAETEYLQTII